MRLGCAWHVTQPAWVSGSTEEVVPVYIVQYKNSVSLCAHFNLVLCMRLTATVKVELGMTER